MARKVITQVVEGWTGRLTFTLMSKAPGATTESAFVGTGFTLSDLVLTQSNGIAERPANGVHIQRQSHNEC